MILLDWMNFRWLLVLCSFFLYVGWKCHSKKIGVFVSMMCSTGAIWHYYVTQHLEVAPTIWVQMQRDSLFFTLQWCVCLAVVALRIKPKFMWFYWLALLNAALMYYHFAFGGLLRGLGVQSMNNAVFQALLIPFAIRAGASSWGLLIIGLPLLLAQSAMGIMALVVMATLLVLHRLKKWWLLLLPIPTLLFMDQLFFEFFSLNGRGPIWTTALEFFKLYPGAIVWGVGAGSWSSLAPSLQKAYNVSPNQIFIHLHNDYLQMLFELGPIITVLFWGFLLRLGIKSIKLKEPSYMCFWGALAVVSVGSFPFHVADQFILFCLMLSEMQTYDQCND